MIRKICIAAAALVACAGSATADSSLNVTELLTAQNRYRAEVGESPLRWSAALAASAQRWAQQLAQHNQMVHSGESSVGENLAMWSSGKSTLTHLVDMWGAEKQFFVHQSFPSVSATGDWKSVAHYTQLIWKDTTDVGCGMASGGGNDFLVCQYSPQGNIFGEKVY